MAAEGKAAEAEVVAASASAEEVAEWLRTAKGGKWAALADALEGIDGEDVHGFTKEDLERICGTARGAALYNVLHRELLPRRASPASRSLASSAAQAGAAATCTGSTSRASAACSALLQTSGAVPLAAAARRTAPPT